MLSAGRLQQRLRARPAAALLRAAATERPAPTSSAWRGSAARASPTFPAELGARTAGGISPVAFRVSRCRGRGRVARGRPVPIASFPPRGREVGSPGGGVAAEPAVTAAAMRDVRARGAVLHAYQAWRREAACGARGCASVWRCVLLRRS